jgi:hypothetical protein
MSSVSLPEPAGTSAGGEREKGEIVMRTFLASIAVLALLAGTASAAIYSDNFDSYTDGDDLTGGVGTPQWEGINFNSMEKHTAVGQEVARANNAGDGWPNYYRSSWANVAAHAGEPYARVQVDFYHQGTQWGANQAAHVFLNATNVPDIGQYCNSNLYRASVGNYGYGTGINVPGELGKKPLNPTGGLNADTWYTFILEGTYGATQIDFLGTLKVKATGTIRFTHSGTITAASTPWGHLSGGYGGMATTDFGSNDLTFTDWKGGYNSHNTGQIYLDNFELEYSPEPATAVIVGIGALLALLRLRKRK